MYERVVKSRRKRERYFSLATRFYRGFPFDRIVYDMHTELLGEEQNIHQQGLVRFSAGFEWEGVNYWEVTARLIDSVRESATLEKI